MGYRKEVVWGEGVKRRLLEVLVWTVMSYGVKVWGWRERERNQRKNQKGTEVGSGNSVENAKIYSKGRIEIEQIKNKDGKKGMRFRREIEGRYRERVSEEVQKSSLQRSGKKRNNRRGKRRGENLWREGE